MRHPAFLNQLLARWTPRPALTRAACVPMLFGALVLVGCGGGGVDEPVIDASVEAPRDATIQPVTVRPVQKSSAYDELQGDHRVGMAGTHDE